MRRRRLVALGFVLSMLVATPALAPAQGLCPGVDGYLLAMGDEKLAVSSSAVGFTASNYRSGGLTAVAAIFSTETDSIRYRVTGSNPTSNTGHLVTAGSVAVVCGSNQIANFKAIRVTTDASIYATFYRRR